MGNRDFEAVFVVGVPRSGTTLVRMVLGAHPEVYAGAEAPWFGGNYGRPDASIRGLFERLVADEYGPVNTMPSISEDAVRVGLRRFVQTMLRRELARTGKGIWVEKTPDNMIQVPFITTLFPQARIVHVLRDGRDVALSSLKTNWPVLNHFVSFQALSTSRTLRMAKRLGLPPKPLRRDFAPMSDGTRMDSALRPSSRPLVYAPLRKTYAHALWRWREWLGTFEQDARATGCAVLEVRYEDLLHRPEAHFKKIFTFLGLDWRPECLDYARAMPTRWPGSDMGARSALAHDGIIADNANKWPAELSLWRRLITRRYFDRFLVAKGYGATR